MDPPPRSGLQSRDSSILTPNFSSTNILATSPISLRRYSDHTRAHLSLLIPSFGEYARGDGKAAQAMRGDVGGIFKLVVADEKRGE